MVGVVGFAPLPPKLMPQFFSFSPPPDSLSGSPAGRRRAAIVTFRGYEMHARRESEALLEAGYDVDLLCLRRPGEARNEVVANGPGRSARNLRFTRFRIPKTRDSLGRYAISYVQWFFYAAVVLTARHLRRRYNVIQVTSLPDHQVFATLIPKLLGAKVVLFCKEPASELFSTLYGSPLLTKIMGWLELRSIAFADMSFAVTEQHRQFYIERGADADKIQVVVNSTPNSALSPKCDAPKLSGLDTVTLICPGTIEERWGHECLVRALAKARVVVPGLRLVISGEGSFEPRLKRIVDELNLTDAVDFEGWVSLERLQVIFENADIGIVAQSESSYSNLVHTGKMYEYMMFGLPVVASRLHATESYFDDDKVVFFESENVDDLASVLIDLAEDPEVRLRMAKSAQVAFDPYRWSRQSDIYIKAIEQL